MSRLRHSTVTFAVLALVATVLTLATTPATAQADPPPPQFFSFTNGMTNPDDDNDGVPDTRWQVQVTAGTLAQCVPKRAKASYTSPWINAGEQVGVSLANRECVYRISAKVRQAAQTACTFRAQLGWTDSGGTLSGDYRDGSLLSSSRPGNETRLTIRRDPAAGCARPHRTYFVLGGDDIVEDLPGGENNADLRARARRAVAVGDYTVGVVPTGLTVAPGCDIATTFTLSGDRSTSPQELGATADSCPSRALIVKTPAHVTPIAGAFVDFDAALPNIIVDLSSLVRVKSARIAVVQDVAGSANRGEAVYSITRSCGGVALPSPAAQRRSSELFEGRFTVHSPDIPQFGPVGVYPVLATSRSSSTVVGCSVSVTVTSLTSGCSVAGGNTQTLTSTAADPVSSFDFEFDVYCGDATPPPPPTPTPAPPPGPDDAPAEEPSGAEPGLGSVRIVARKLSDGRIEFGLQQQTDATTWGARVLPSDRYFPTGAAVGEWLVSSPVALRVRGSGDASGEDVRLRLTARLVGDGRVEFALQQRADDGAWGDRRAPTRRFFPAGAKPDRWRHSSVVALAR